MPDKLEKNKKASLENKDEISLKKEESKKRQLANLRPIKKGEVRNPHGRPKKEVCITSIINEMLTEQANIKDKNGVRVEKTWLQLYSEAVLRHAIKGNSTAIKEIWDRIDGKQSQDINLNVRRIEDELRALPPPRPRKKQTVEIEGRPDVLLRQLPESRLKGEPH